MLGKVESWGIISSGVDSKGEVEFDTPPKPLIKLLVKFNEAVEVERTNIFAPFVGIAGLVSLPLSPSFAKDARFL